MKLKTIFLFSATCVLQNVYAQEYVDPKPKAIDPVKKSIRISQAELYPYMHVQLDHSGTIADFRRLAPGSMLLKRDYSTFSESNGTSVDIDAAFSAAVGISFANKKLNEYRNMKLRIGINYSSYSSHIGNAHKTSYIHYDTLTSSGSGNPAYLDSVRHESLSMHYSTQELRADISLIFSTNPEARWALYGGIGVTLGASVKSYADISYNEYYSLQTTYEGNVTTLNTYQDGSNSTSERITDKGGFGYSVYIPVGVDYRLANRSEFFKRIHLFYEAKPFLNYSTVGALGMTADVGINHGVGVRVKF